MTDNAIDWQALQKAAKQAHGNAYAPYSKFYVGSAALCTDGNIVGGCNVENASYGLTQCAERNSIATAVANGQKIAHILVYTEQKELTPPCGACRQVIAEFLPAEAIVRAQNHLGEHKDWTVQQLLPDAFTPQNLANARKN